MDDPEYDFQVQRLEHAARALEWHGHLVPDNEVLGTRFTAVVRLKADVHRWRIDHGWPPQADPATFHAWSDPDTHDHLPVSAIDLIGILVTVPHVRQAVRACGTLLTLAPCAVVLPGDHPYRPWRLTELDYYGIGVVTSTPEGPADPVLAAEDRRGEFGTSAFARWLHEVLYSRMLRDHRRAGANRTHEAPGR